MTSSMNAPVTCPNCHASGEAEVWTSVNNAENPDEAQWLIDGFLFRYACPSCGHESALNHDCVYHDAHAHVMVLYAADRTRAQNAQEELERRVPEGYRVRAVHTIEELREKAAIFRDGLDDRAVEIAKLAITNKFVEEGQLTPQARAYYGATDGNGDIIVEFITGAGEPPVETSIPRSVYDGIADSLTDAQSTVVDRAWASQVLARWS